MCMKRTVCVFQKNDLLAVKVAESCISEIVSFRTSRFPEAIILLDDLFAVVCAQSLACLLLGCRLVEKMVANLIVISVRIARMAILVVVVAAKRVVEPVLNVEREFS